MLPLSGFQWNRRIDMPRGIADCCGTRVFAFFCDLFFSHVDNTKHKTYDSKTNIKMSLLMRIYEKNERERKASLAQQPRSAKRDQDLEIAGSDTSSEGRDDPNFAAYSPHARQPQNVNRNQDLSVNNRSVASRVWCDDAELKAPKEPCRDNQDTVMDSAVSGGIDSSQAAVCSRLTHQRRNAKQDQDLNDTRPEMLRRWCHGPDLESPERMYPEKYADQDKIVESAVIGESESMSSQDAVVTPTNRRPGAYAVFLGRSMQHRQDDAGTTTATVDPTTVVNEEFTPIAAEVAEDTLLDISSHIRRVLAEDAVPASSVAALNGSGDWLDKSTRTEGESSRHWRRLILVILCLILVAVAATASVVVLKLTKDSEPTTRITIVIKLDDHPEETGWELHQGSKKVEAYPPGSYRGDKNEEIITKTDVCPGEEYTFTLYDTRGNGIDGGYYKIYDAPDTSNPSTLLVEGSGNFTDEVQHDFVPVGQETKEEAVGPALQGDEEECIDCEVTDWSDWSPCSAACNSGTRSRTRAALISGNECGHPCPAFVETEQCNTEPCPTECPHECCGDTECQVDEKCLDNKCNPICECGCSEPYICNVEANCECICPYECCSSDLCSDDKICSGNPNCSFGRCVHCDNDVKVCEYGEECNCSTGECISRDPPCECDCSAPYTCKVEANCECICPHECCEDDDCTGDNQVCSVHYTCMSMPSDPPPCECGCSAPYTCDVEANCECICPHECCKDGDCAGDNQMCSDDYTCMPKPTDPTPCECDCSAPYTCLNCECICPHECCKDGDCIGENQTCSGDYTCMPKHTDPTPGADCDDCPSPYTCKENDGCICPYECCKDNDCAGGNKTCSGNYTCTCLCDCPEMFVCNDFCECTCSYECCDNSYCPEGRFCSLNPICAFGKCSQCTEGDSENCYKYEYCDCNTGDCVCPDECCDDSHCAGDYHCIEGDCTCACFSNDDCPDAFTCTQCSCEPPCDCDCERPYLCDVVDNCKCYCPILSLGCCSDFDCEENQVCSDDLTCKPKVPCECSEPYVCSEESHECYCPYKCCIDGDCNNENQRCSPDYTCVCKNSCPDFHIRNDDCECICSYPCCYVNEDCSSGEICSGNHCEEVCECDCPSPYTCDDNCECDCPYECCGDDDCGGGICVSNECEEVCECDCPSPYTCDDNCECDCPYECCGDGDCGGGICVSNECEEVCECDCPSPYTCDDNCECDCPYECCGDDDCGGGICVSNECEEVCECDCPSPYTCDDNCECDCPYECCGDGDCGGGICVSNECEEVCECDCPSPYTCDDNCECDCPYECCGDGDCGGGICVSNECEEVCECDCPSPYTCNDNCECDCPYDCCNEGDCNDDEYCGSDHTCHYEPPA